MTASLMRCKNSENLLRLKTPFFFIWGGGGGGGVEWPLLK